MKILYIIDSHPQNGGAPISTCSIATEFSNSLNSIYLMLPKQDKSYLLNDSIQTVELDGFENTFPYFINQPILAFKLIWKIRSKINLIKPDIIHVHMPRAAWGVGILKSLNLLSPKIKLIYTDRDQVNTYKWPLKKLSYFLIKKQFHKIVCLTDISANQWKNTEIETIPNSAGRNFEIYNRTFHNKVRKQNNISDEFTTVMFSGRMSPDKNWELAKRIAISLKEEKIFFVFVIATVNREQEVWLQDFIKDLLLENVRHIIFNNVSQENMADLYYLSDIFVLTSNKESFGRTAIEAMSRKSVVIGRKVGGIPEVIRLKENILSDNVQEFHDRIIYYIQNPSVMNMDKELFYNRFIKEYSTYSNTKKHEILYKSVVNSKI